MNVAQLSELKAYVSYAARQQLGERSDTTAKPQVHFRPFRPLASFLSAWASRPEKQKRIGGFLISKRSLLLGKQAGGVCKV